MPSVPVERGVRQLMNRYGFQGKIVVTGGAGDIGVECGKLLAAGGAGRLGSRDPGQSEICIRYGRRFRSSTGIGRGRPRGVHDLDYGGPRFARLRGLQHC